MKEKYVIYKLLGETPLEALERLRAAENIPLSTPMTYAGRLDPAAEGLLIILTGEECKNKDAYTALPKTYLAEILVGISTDSFDLVGTPSLTRRGQGEVLKKITPPQSSPQQGEEAILKNAEAFLETKMGAQTQSYPPYSSKTVDGIQLHEHTRSGTDVTLPTHEVTLQEYTDLSIEQVTSEELLMRVGELLLGLTGDFRQKEIAEAWAELDLPEKLPVLSVTLKVSSGFYIRQLAEDLGNALGSGACLYSLVRTEVGEYTKAEL